MDRDMDGDADRNLDRDREIRLKPLPKPVYKPPAGFRETGARGGQELAGRRENRASGSVKPGTGEYHKSTPDDFPAVRRKVRPTARDTYTASPANTPKRKSRLSPKKRAAVKISTKAPRGINQNALFWGIASLAFSVFIVVIVWGLTKKNAYEIFVNGESAGKVAMSNGVGEDSVLAAATARLKDENKTDVRINETVSAELVHVSKGGALTLDEIVEEVTGRLTYDIMAAAIYVDGGMKGVLRDTAAAAAALDRVKAQYRQDGLNIISEDFIEDVKVEPEYVGKDLVQSPDEVFAALMASSDKRDIYTIVEGDYLQKVAIKYGMTVDEILRANPEITADTTLKIGQQLNITTPSPILSVQTVEEVTMTEVEPMPVQEQLNPNERSAYRKIIQQGADGQKEVTYHITRINGYKQAPVAVNTIITKAPVAQIEEIGTK